MEKDARTAICLRMLLEVIQEVCILFYLEVLYMGKFSDSRLWSEQITNEEAYEAEESGLIFDITNTSVSKQIA